MKTKLCSIMFALLPGLTACGVQGAAYSKTVVPPNKSAIYLYRQPANAPFIPPLVAMPVARSLPPVNCGDYSVALGPGGYHRFLAEPGHVRCSVYTEVTSAVEFDVQPGESYYVEESLHSGFTQVRIHLDAVPSDVAQAEINDCKEQ